MARRAVDSLLALCVAFLSACGARHEGRGTAPAGHGARRGPALPLAEVGRLEIGGQARCVATLVPAIEAAIVAWGDAQP